MKKLTLTLLIVLISLIFINCENSIQSTIESQMASVQIYHDTTGIEVFLSIDSDPMTHVKYLEINDFNTTFPKDQSYNFLGSHTQSIFIPNIENPEDLTLTLQTGIGELAGNINLPGIPYNVSIPDSIAQYEDIEISWSGNADYYNVTLVLYHQYFDRYLSRHIGIDYITDKKVSIPWEKLNYDGVITTVYIQSVNGPIPGEGCEGNMSGDGGGYMYYYNELVVSDLSIIVGDGIPVDNLEMGKIDTKEITQKLREELRQKLLEFGGKD